MLLEDGTEHIGSGPFPPGKGTAAEPHPDFVFSHPFVRTPNFTECKENGIVTRRANILSSIYDN